MKICSGCKEEKEYSEYFKNKGNKDGYQNFCKICATAKRKEWMTPKKRRQYSLKTSYGLSYEEYEDLLEEQGHSCAICKTKEPKGRHNTWHVDHNHKTGMIRGLLCNDCNIGLGCFNDDKSILKAAIGYL